IPQLVAPGEVEARTLFPSFMYVPHPSELPADSLSLPWSETAPSIVAGELARALGSKSALRLISSAKSWLCQASVDRRSACLPVAAPDDAQKISPLAATTHYLNHLQQAWTAARPDSPLSEQLVAIGVPASFDPAARELTAEAARSAGLPHAVL